MPDLWNNLPCIESKISAEKENFDFASLYTNCLCIYNSCGKKDTVPELNLITNVQLSQHRQNNGFLWSEHKDGLLLIKLSRRGHALM